jgi:hypothetical protein
MMRAAAASDSAPSTDEFKDSLIERIRHNVPPLLLEQPVWLLHAGKVPMYPSGANRSGVLDSPEDRANLVTFEQAASALLRNPCARGLGIALGQVPGEELQINGIDFDHCCQGGELHGSVLQVLAAADSYAERSISGEGVHILGTGDIGTLKVPSNGKLPGIEVYSGARFFVMTGERINQQDYLADTREAAELARQLWGVKGSGGPGASSSTTDDPVLLELKRCGLYLRDGTAGKHLVRCPWSALHSENGQGGRNGTDSEAVYFSASAANNGQGGFRCLHTHCAGRGIRQLREYLGLTRRSDAGNAETLRQELQALTFPTLAQVNAADIAPKQALVRDLLYPGAWLIVGRPKIGKSWLILQLALAVALCSTFLGFPCMLADVEVLCIFAEDDDARLKGRLQALGCASAPASCHVINQTKLLQLAQRYAAAISFTEFLETWLQRHPAVRLVIIDTETTVRQIWNGEAADDGAQRVTETDYRQTRAFDEIGLRRQVVIGLVNHASKRRGEWVDIHELINRSNTALAGASGSIALADPPDADPFDPKSKTRILGVRGRDLHEDILLAVHQDEEVPCFLCDGPYAEVRQSEAEQEVLLAVEDLMGEVPADAYVSAAELAEAMNKNRGAVKRTITRMLAKNRRTWKSWRITNKRGKDGGLRLDRAE